MSADPRQARFHLLHDLDRIYPRLHHHVDQHCLAEIAASFQIGFLVGRLDRGDISQAHRGRGAVRHHGAGDIADIAEAVVGNIQIKLMVLFQATGEFHGVGLLQGLGGLLIADMVSRQLVRIEVDPVFPLVTAQHLDVEDSRDVGQLGAKGIYRQIAQCQQVEAVGIEAVACHREGTGIDPPDVDLHTGREYMLDAAHLGLHQLVGLEHILLPAEMDVDLGRSAIGRGTHHFHPRHHHHCFFDRFDDLGLHLGQRGQAVIDQHGDAGKFCVREYPLGNLEDQVSAGH